MCALRYFPFSIITMMLCALLVTLSLAALLAHGSWTLVFCKGLRDGCYLEFECEVRCEVEMAVRDKCACLEDPTFGSPNHLGKMRLIWGCPTTSNAQHCVSLHFRFP